MVTRRVAHVASAAASLALLSLLLINVRHILHPPPLIPPAPPPQVFLPAWMASPATFELSETSVADTTAAAGALSTTAAETTPLHDVTATSHAATTTVGTTPDYLAQIREISKKVYQSIKEATGGEVHVNLDPNDITPEKVEAEIRRLISIDESRIQKIVDDAMAVFHTHTPAHTTSAVASTPAA